MKNIILSINNDQELLIIHYGLTTTNHTYFSITGEIWKQVNGKKVGRDCISCGCIHDDIMKHAPEYSDLIALHLSDENGTPTYAIENGWYWLGHSKYQTLDRDIAKKHFRVSDDVMDVLVTFTEKQQLIDYVEKHLKPIWKNEAQNAIEKYNLKNA